MTREERIEMAKARGTYRRPLLANEPLQFHATATKLMGGPVSGLVMWDAPTAVNGRGSRMVKVTALYADGMRALWNVRRGYCIADNDKGES